MATPGISWRFTASLPANIQLRRVLPQPMAVYSEVWDVPENHGVPGSSPGPATHKIPAKRKKFEGLEPPGLMA